MRCRVLKSIEETKNIGRKWVKEALREKCLNMELFVVRIFLYSVQIQEDMDQKQLGIWTFFTK